MEISLQRRSVFTDGWFLAALAIVLVGLGILGKFWFRSVEPARRPTFDIVRCTECGVEHPYIEALVAARCEDCGVGVYRPDVSQSGPRVRWDRIVGLALIAILALSGLAHFGISRARVMRSRAEQELMQRLIYRCPICDRKISYSILKVGSVHVCSGCKTAFALPDADAPDE